MHIFIFLLISVYPMETSGCYTRFPLKDTVDTIKALVNIFGKPASDVEPDGTEWMNMLIPEKEDGYQV